MPEYDNFEMISGSDYDQFTFFYYWSSKYIIRFFCRQYTDSFFKIIVMKENDEIFDELKIEVD
jgi:hypothetical protein